MRQPFGVYELLTKGRITEYRVISRAPAMTRMVLINVAF